MARRCELTGKDPMAGKNVSHAQNKTSRRFLPNLTRVSLLSDVLGVRLRLKISVSTLRSVDHAGGIDAFLMGSSDERLSRRARFYKKRILRALAE